MGWDRDKEALQKLCVELMVSYEERASIVDITNYEEVVQVVTKVEAELGPITCLVNNAGINLGPRLFKNEPRENWLKVVNVNTMGMLNVTSTIFPLMASRKSGHVVNISSVCGKSVLENHVVYGAGKFFLEGFSEGLRREGLRDGIKVTVIRPSATITNLGARENDGNKSITAHVAHVDLDPESEAVQNEKRHMSNARNLCNLPWLMDAEEVGKVVANVLTLPDGVVINELNIS